MTSKTIAENVRKVRLSRSVSQKQLAKMIGKSESYIADIENQKSSPTIVVLEKIASVLKSTLEDLLGVDQEEQDKFAEFIKLRIFNLDDRLTVSGILLKNGYTVGQTKRKKTETGKNLDYFLVAKLEDDNADTAR